MHYERADYLDELRTRTRKLNARRVQAAGRDYVLCWLQQTLRASDNPIIDVAILQGNRLNLPVLVYHGLGHRYPYASHRLHQFILEASKSLEKGVTSRGLQFVRYLEYPGDPKGLLYGLARRAAVVVTDDQPVFVASWQAESLAARSTTAVHVVDATCMVPMQTFTKPLTSTKAFRAAHRPLRATFLEEPEAPRPTHPIFEGELPFVPLSLKGIGSKRMARLIQRCSVDMSVPPAPQFRGTREAGISRLQWALDEVLPTYNFRRNNASDVTAGSRLSPYLHFGVLSAREVARAVNELDIHSAPRWKFLDELLTWREYFHHLARRSKRPSSYSGVPKPARETLDAHAGDPRPKLYSLDELIHGETGDPTWNAAQKQYLFEGYMHNNLRMYWGKRLIAWHATPQQAWQTACYLNDRFSLDGRDPATYGNLQWCFGRSKTAYREAPVYGWVPKKSDAGMRRRKGVPAWIERESARTDYRVSTPAELPADLPPNRL